MRVPRTARRSNQCILKEITLNTFTGRTDLKLQYHGHVNQRADSLEKTLILGKIEGRRRRGRQRMRWLHGIADSMGRSCRKIRDTAEAREAWRAAARGPQRVGHA